jgi:chromatin licensing and DNA replication factor 1
VKEKEERALEEKETGFADQVKRQKLIASLPSTFDIIFLIYQSRQRSVMTKQELIHKIIASSPKIADRSMFELLFLAVFSVFRHFLPQSFATILTLNDYFYR